MHLAVLADIHGNLPALESVLAEIQRQNVDGLILVGDYLTGGPNPAEVIQLLQSLDDDCWMIRGNTDIRVLAFDSRDVPDAWYSSRSFITRPRPTSVGPGTCPT